jgi:cytoskeletal protein CcmA (bactofilin family)
MNLIENKTKFTHINMPSWGVGVYRKSDGDYITVEFENAGIKKLSKATINSMLMPVGGTIETTPTPAPKKQSATKNTYAPVNDHNGSLIQYDGEASCIAGKNVIEAFEGNDSIIFNETYMIVGEHTKALKIHAMYDLTIIGDVTAQECVVNGSLTIIGDAHIANLTCYNTFICKGNLHADKIYVGRNIIVGSIDCDDIICDGNVVLQTTANINQNAKIGKTMVACEGIMGAGTFSAINAIANEYFEFDGEYEGKILELETDATISNTVPVKVAPCETIEDIINLANKKLEEEYDKCPDLDEEEIIKHLKKLGAIQSRELKFLPIVEPLFTKLTEISYQDRIETIDEYLTVLMAQKMLPTEVYKYESVDHVGKLFLPKAQSEIDELGFEPCTIEQFSRVLSMAVKFEEVLSADWEILMDKVFESIGLKYSTVSSMINRNKPKQSVQSITAESVDEPVEDSEEIEPEPAPVPAVPRMKKVDFLAKKLSHTGKKFGLTDVELERMATIKIRTFGDLVQASDIALTKVFGKKAFLANHLIQTRDKIIEKLADME